FAHRTTLLRVLVTSLPRRACRLAAMKGTVVITGSTHGIGYVTARELARAGCHVVMLVRDLGRGERIRTEIAATAPGAAIDVIHCDLASLASVRGAAKQVQLAVGTIDCLINNAGIVAMERKPSVDGFELVFATNHLGPFLLTELLRDRVIDG